MSVIKVQHHERTIEFDSTCLPEGLLYLPSGIGHIEELSKEEFDYVKREEYRGDYLGTRAIITDLGLNHPTIAEVVSLFHEVLMNKPKSEYGDAVWRMTSGWTYGFTGNLHVPKEGVYVQDDPPIIDEKIMMTREELREKLVSEENNVLYSSDRRIRFAPWENIPKGVDDFLSDRNAHLIALVGEEGRKKLEDIRKKFNLHGFISGNKRMRKEFIGASSLQFCGVGPQHANSSLLAKNDPNRILGASALDLSTLAGIDSRPYLGAGAAFGIMRRL